MYQLKKIDIATVALYSFLIFLILGLVIFLPLGILSFIFSNLLSRGDFYQHGPSHFFPVFGGIFLLLMPLAYGIIGMIINTLIALLYNLLSIKLGGIKVQLDKIETIEVL
jgi:hypothetical protein